MAAGWIIVIIVAIIVVVVVARSVRIIPQARAGVVERLGAFKRVLNPGVAVLMPFVDRVRATIDMREQVVSFPPQPVITSDNLTVNIDTVVYFQVTNPYDATYSIANYIQAVEQLTITTLRNVVGGMNLEEALTSRDRINTRLRGELDEATGMWGIRVGRVELKAIDPPPSIQDSMEKQMRADRDKRAIILQAEGQRESAIKTAEGEKAALILSAEGQKQSIILQAEAERQSRILKAEGERAARYLSSQGQAKAIETVFKSIHLSNPDPKLLAYQYLQTLPQIAQGDANKMWIVPTEFSKALDGLASLGGNNGSGEGSSGSWLTNAGNDQPAGMLGESDLDASDWFDSKLAPEPISPQELRASDHDPDSRLAHQGLPEEGQTTPNVSIPSVSVPSPVIPGESSTTQPPAEDKPGPDTAEQPAADQPAETPYRPQLPRQDGKNEPRRERQRWSQQGSHPGQPQPESPPNEQQRPYNNPPPWESGSQR
ncbi:MAG TPA: SPFH domain-containing protein [Mycobacteriales bacterium]|nr:SPFH domain-containing protein [Mycobacteriales bacterium]